jgi:hypothetical protein
MLSSSRFPEIKSTMLALNRWNGTVKVSYPCRITEVAQRIIFCFKTWWIGHHVLVARTFMAEPLMKGSTYLYPMTGKLNRFQEGRFLLIPGGLKQPGN